MDTPIHLQIPSKVVQIADERFTLQEMSAARSIAYLKIFESAAAAAEQDPMPAGVPADDSSMTAWRERDTARWNEPIRFLLGKDDAWIEANMVRSTKTALIAIQRDLNYPTGVPGGNAPSPGSASA